MKFVMSLGCIKLRLLPEEAFNAVTINAAYAMGLSHDYGSITIGKKSTPYPHPSYSFTRIYSLFLHHPNHPKGAVVTSTTTDVR
jgi:imidazolonepropionase